MRTCFLRLHVRSPGGLSTVSTKSCFDLRWEERTWKEPPTLQIPALSTELVGLPMLTGKLHLVCKMHIALYCCIALI
jgi:hypothetical protein